MADEKDDLFFSEEDFEDKAEWLEYSKHVHKEEEEREKKEQEFLRTHPGASHADYLAAKEAAKK
ncbi:hypothetical protein AXE65_10255 [Ventosimonas gracilis]|uniref:Uncharacterized protein n=1 Tax=Ventosimonas gracilis TaxID=1680762 RepID=A0A139SWU0_9GAMM|nr:hypothetical protein [Ventosimonas gracilis]KXU39085.1 hypothetical protein AXE65_10255 [Ventosimonas gracilis]